MTHLCKLFRGQLRLPDNSESLLSECVGCILVDLQGKDIKM